MESPIYKPSVRQCKTDWKRLCMPLITHVGADAKPFSRTFRKHDPNTGQLVSTIFKGSMGVCLTIQDKQELLRTYDEAMDEIFKDANATREKTSYSSHELSGIFGARRDAYVDALEYFVQQLGKLTTLKINFVYTVLNTLLLKDGVKYYGYGRSPVKIVTPLEFLDAIDSYYSYICAWKVTKSYKIMGTNVLLDHFKGNITSCWSELLAHHRVTVIPNGDLCNPIISSADLCVRYFDEMMYQEHMPLSENSINQILESKNIQNGNVFYVGNPDLPDITPMERSLIRLDHYYPRPMVFILKEGVMQSETEYVKTRRPLIMKIEKYASDHDTGYKFIDYAKDAELLKDGDIVISLGPRGKEQFDFLTGIGYKLTMVSIADLDPSAAMGHA